MSRLTSARPKHSSTPIPSSHLPQPSPPSLPKTKRRPKPSSRTSSKGYVFPLSLRRAPAPDKPFLQREALISQLARLLDSESALTASALKQNNLSRHRQILLDHRRELSRLRSNITDARNRANLLSNVRSDIDAYRSSNPGAAEAEYMLDERRRIDNSHSMADSVLSQAYAVNESFGVQRETLASINRRIVGAASQVPGINSLMARIGAKKRRDGIILGSFIAFCFLVLYFFG